MNFLYEAKLVSASSDTHHICTSKTGFIFKGIKIYLGKIYENRKQYSPVR